MVNVMVGGTSDSSRADRSTFFYMRPEVWSVTPVELNAGTVSVLTISGTNFGADLAVEYAGRIFSTEQEGQKNIERRYDPLLLPIHPDSVSWWDWAQYRVCYSEAPSNLVSELSGDCCTSMSCWKMEECCNHGTVYSSDIILR